MWRNCITCPVHVPYMSRLKNIVVKESGFSLTTMIVFEQNELRPKSWTQCQIVWEKVIIL